MSAAPETLVSTEVHISSKLAGDEEIRLLQVDPTLLEVLKKLPSNGTGAVIKGEPGGEAVMCTTDKTFRLQKLENTNLLLLAPRSDSEHKIEARVTHTIEVLPTPPRLERLQALLAEGTFTEADAAAGCTQLGTATQDSQMCPPGPKRRRTYTTAELEERVQASPAELDSALQKSGAVQIDGRWRSVAEGPVAECLTSLVRVGGACFDLESFTWGEVTSAIGDLHDPVVVSCCVNRFCSRLDEAGAITEGTRFRLDARKVAVLRARELLHGAETWGYDDFMTQWNEACPPGVLPDASWLGGFVISRTVDGKVCQLTRFFETDLPLPAKERFQALFRVKKGWRKEEILPFIEPISGPGQSVTELMRRYARPFKDNGEEVLMAPW
eukprot:TRINITY_DN13065_c0_g1_i1.p1 TRINITY_DN13065_c0_g1~~TRINITY_DN13065_c0_g1_i1.p1  ORF type:complete len:406 (+),score=125.54 TRINITY_DN13065_c0_g1_i1:71-1219(+)